MIGAVEDGNVGKAPGSIPQAGSVAVGVQHVDAADHAVDFLGNEDGLRQTGFRCHQTHRLAMGTGGRKPALTARIAGDERKRGGEYLRGGAVAGGKPYGAGSRKILFQQVEAPAVRTPEAVDGLVRVTDDKEFPSALVPCLDELVLDRVDVLEFIHQQIGKMLLPVFCFLFLLKKAQHVEKQVVEVHKLPAVQCLLVPGCCFRCQGEVGFPCRTIGHIGCNAFCGGQPCLMQRDGSEKLLDSAGKFQGCYGFSGAFFRLSLVCQGQLYSGLG